MEASLRWFLQVMGAMGTPLVFFVLIYKKGYQYFSIEYPSKASNSPERKYRIDAENIENEYKEHTKLVRGLPLLLSFIGGFFLGLPTLFFAVIIQPVILFPLLSAFLLAGVEESIKALLPYLLCRKTGKISIMKILFLFLSSSSGFALFENALLVFRDPAILFLRTFTSVPLHLGASLIFGFAYGYSKIYYRSRSLIGFLGATILHGTFNLGWQGKGLVWVSLLSLGILLFTAPAVFKRAVQWEFRV